MNLINVFNSIQENGGATYNMNTSELNPSTGYIVALVGFEKVIEKIPQTFANFQDVLLPYLDRKVWDAIGGREDIYLGFWINDGKLYLDLVERIEDRFDAIKEGWKRGQIAIWDAKTKEEITVRTKVSNDPDIETDRRY